MALVIVEDPKEVSELESAAVLKLLGDDFAHSRFPMKVWRLASEPTFGPIKWAEDGKSLIIDEQALEPMLGHFFRSDKFSSFLRQLHLYGFRKMSKPHSFKALPDRNNKPKKKGRSSLDGFAEYAAKDFERDQYESINKVRRFYNNAIREKKTNRSSGSSQSSLSSETSSQATLLSDERRKQMLAEHSYPLTEGQQQQPPPLSTLPTPTATTGPVPIMNRPLPSPYAEGTSGHYPQLNHHGRFIYPFPHMPLIYSPSTGTYSPPGFADGFGAGFGYCSPVEPLYPSYPGFGSGADQNSRDSGISDSSFSSSNSSSNDSFDASSFFQMIDPSQPYAVAYYPVPVMMPTPPATTAPH